MIITECCGSKDILQDAFVNPNTAQMKSSSFENYVCDNEDCESYGIRCSAKTE